MLDVYNIDEVFTALRERIDRLKDRNAFLEEENKKLKEGVWADEEMARLKQDYDLMHADWLRGFPVSEEEKAAIQEFLNQHRSEVPTKMDLCGPVTYSFTEVGIGSIGEVSVTRHGKTHKFVFRKLS